MIEEGYVCVGDTGHPVRVVPRVTTRQYEFKLHVRESVPPAWVLDTSIRVVGTGDEFALYGLASERVTFRLPEGVTLETLRARIDSIRRVKP